MEKKIWRGLRGPLCRRREGKREGEKEREAEKRRGGGFVGLPKGITAETFVSNLQYAY